MFTTSQGSRYLEDAGRTVRTTAAGVSYEPSFVTFYLSGLEAAAFMYRAAMLGLKVVPGWNSRRPVLYFGNDQVVDKTILHPAVGLHPVEIWEDMTWHVGNPITEIVLEKAP